MKCKYNLSIYDASKGINADKVYHLMMEEVGIKEVFGGRLDRYMNSAYSYIISASNEDAGFFNLVVEKANTNFLFLDMGIKHKFRNQGIGKEIMEYVAASDIREPIIGETKISNIGANRIASEVGKFLFTLEDRNIYLIQKEKEEAFLQNNGIERLKEHFDREDDKSLILRYK